MGAERKKRVAVSKQLKEELFMACLMRVSRGILPKGSFQKIGDVDPLVMPLPLLLRRDENESSEPRSRSILGTQYELVALGPVLRSYRFILALTNCLELLQIGVTQSTEAKEAKEELKQLKHGMVKGDGLRLAAKLERRALDMLFVLKGADPTTEWRKKGKRPIVVLEDGSMHIKMS
ncbi:hypothetical protein IV203_013494 [Nitzschia inconspicua]|uniref:Uncharacterized protein n=1 Tax=Nitzschia inconspicua TaxID=303405 RepID=A0A9K3QA67_9STRA|nr:hypothetical protein IV203_013494 [Nitzschia inconspicua]